MVIEIGLGYECWLNVWIILVCLLHAKFIGDLLMRVVDETNRVGFGWWRGSHVGILRATLHILNYHFVFLYKNLDVFYGIRVYPVNRPSSRYV